MPDRQLKILWPNTVHGRWMCEDYERELVSVIVPTFNRANLLLESINSIFNQVYRPIELLIIDDGSTDNTEKIVRKWASERSDDEFSIKYFKQKKTKL